MRLLEGPKLPERLNFIPGLKNSNLSGNGQFVVTSAVIVPVAIPMAMDRITARNTTSMAVTEPADSAPTFKGLWVNALRTSASLTAWMT